MTSVIMAIAVMEKGKTMSEYIKYGFDVSAIIPKDKEPAVLMCNGTEYLPMIKCKECKHWSEYMAGIGVCDKLKTDTGEEVFCSYGEKAVGSGSTED